MENIQLPGTQCTLGGEKAVKKLHEEADGLPIELSFGFPTAHLWDGLSERVQTALAAAGNTLPLHIAIATEIVTHKVQPSVATIKGVKNIIAVASGKGGVGKSTTTANLAIAMARMGALDADLYAPSQPTMLGMQDRKPEQENKKLIPVEADGDIQVMSIGFWVDTDQAVVWREPMVSQALQQYVRQSQYPDFRRAREYVGTHLLQLQP